MSKKEIYSWAAFLSMVAILTYYLIRVIGLPSILEPVEGSITSVIIQVVIAGIAVQIVLDIMASSGVGGVHKDERDQIISLKGYRASYYFLMVALVSLAGFVVLQEFQNLSNVPILWDRPFLLFHFLLVTIFAANLVHSGTSIILYRRGG